MAPGYRTNAQTRRGARAGYPEHDDFEGLPVRQWRKQWVNIAPPPEIEENKKKDRWAEELPHGMPKDSDLLPPHSLALLRAARSGCLRKRPAPADDEDGDADALPGDKTDKKASAMDEGFRVRTWKQVPRSEEGSTISYLAKRHKSTITLPSKAFATQTTGPTITKATVRRIDAAGNPYTQEVTVTDGQQVDGEIISTSVIPAPEQAGQAPAAAATPTRRKPPIPQKKKGRGRGRGARGRGRVLPLQPSSRPGPQDGPGVDGATEIKNEGVGPDGVKIEGEDGKAVQDVEMRDSSAVEDDGDDVEGDGDDGDEDDGDESGTPGENEDQEMDDAPALADAAPMPTAAADTPGASSTLAPPVPNPLNTDTARIEGSPLKNVLLRSPTDGTPQIPPMVVQASADVGPSGGPDESTSELQPSPMAGQLQQAPAAEVMEEVPVEGTNPPATATPEKTIQETAVPQTAAEYTTVQDVALPETGVPEPVLKTSVPEPVLETGVSEPVLETAVPEPGVSEPVPDPVPDTVVPEAAVPEAAVPEAAVSEAAVSETAMPEAPVLETAARDVVAPETAVPETAVPETAVPETAVPETAVPEAPVPEAPVSETAAPESAAPDTDMPETIPETAAPETNAPESAEPIPEETMGVVAITSTQEPEQPAVVPSDPPAVLPAAIEQPPPANKPQAETSTADIPIPTSEDPKTGEAPEAENAVAEPEAPTAESAPAIIPASGTAPNLAPVESASVAQAMTEDGTDDGSDLLGPLGASLSRQAEEDVPPPTSAPANSEPEQAKTENGKGEAGPDGTSGGD